MTDETKHTPGPWSQFDDGGALAVNEGAQHTYGHSYADCVWGPLGPGHGLIADCSPHGQAPTAETIANAKLIAAAPDLLAALKLAEGTLSRIAVELRKRKFPTPELDAVRAAITKAEGRS